jgi:hypothetical protein
MTSNHRLAHERSKTAAYVETQRRRLLNITSADSNVDQKIVDADDSKSKLSFILTIFISFSFSRITFLDDKIIIIDDKIISTCRKSIEKKYATKKIPRIKKRKVIHKVSKYFL